MRERSAGQLAGQPLAVGRADLAIAQEAVEGEQLLGGALEGGAEGLHIPCPPRRPHLAGGHRSSPGRGRSRGQLVPTRPHSSVLAGPAWSGHRPDASILPTGRCRLL